MVRTMIISLLYYCLLSSMSVRGQNPIGLRAASNLRGIMLGAAVDAEYLRNHYDNGQYNETIRSNYQLIVPENDLQVTNIWMGENQYNWTNTDYLLGSPNTTGWVQQNLMEIRGHMLVWAYDQQIPTWLLKEEKNITPEKAKQLLSDYIHTVVGRYRGKISSWNVVNEAIDDANVSAPLNIRYSFWFRKLGLDYLRYAFQFAQEADPDTKLYYNEFDIEAGGLKANRTINLVNWLRSQGATVHGVGFQWHLPVTTNITPGDSHYQTAQQFIDNKLNIMITELDVSVPTTGAYPTNFQDLDRQGVVYRSMLDYCLHFLPYCTAMLTWGFTDRYSWIPWFTHDARGAALPLDWMYQPKPAYWQMQETLARVVDDRLYRLSPESQPNKCLGISQNTTNSTQVQLYDGDCNNAYEQWNITWQNDGTYRLSSHGDNNHVLGAYNTTATVGGVQIYNWTGDVNQEWAFSSKGNNTYRIVPRPAWWRVMTVYGTTDDIRIIDPTDTSPQNWILTKV